MRSRISTRIAVLAAVAMAFCVLFASAALAQSDPYGEGKPDVKGTLIQNSQPGEVSVQADTITPEVAGEAAGAILPFTGGQITLFLALGAGAVLLGTFIVRKTQSDN